MKSALVLVDIQNDYFAGGRCELYRPEQAAENAAKLLNYFRAQGLPVFHVQHVNIRKTATFFIPETEGVRIHQSVTPLPTETVVVKHAPNSFFGTGLHEKLVAVEAEHLVLCGMMSHMCIDTTARAAKDYGYAVTLIQDACTTKDLQWGETVLDAQTVHQVFMASLNGIFAKVQKADDFLADCAE